ncbi:MepB family protein [Tenacibaculum sp. M341]|uniref:MepB family protein n=1 Tax=Tenacibaculum sp. M341 TaxID=2530339 RepID=UPI001048D372|nr:MepB family protein [Tenacibaculum sp. M341]TCI93757.1 MepB family protein [Tenacibaculum sp. M341]
MDSNLVRIKKSIFDKCNFDISDFKTDLESTEYHACSFKLNKKHIISRNSKITPKKVGQFVTFWKRSNDGTIAPFHESDLIDFYIINVQLENKLGQFVFPKSILIKKGIISTQKKDGKRGFRVYPEWDTTTNKQAEKTQKWQLNYFYRIDNTIDFKKVDKLYNPI